jgi:hypothetical protein
LVGAPHGVETVTANVDGGLNICPRRVLAQLDKGDVLTVTRLDRLAGSIQLQRPGAEFRSLIDTWADTTTPHGCHA